MTRYTAFPRKVPFDRDCVFTVKRAIKVSGRSFEYGEVLDKTLLTTRRLRQLYEQRFLVQGEKDTPPHLAPNAEIDFKQLPTAAIIHWLAERGKSPRVGKEDRASVINLATVVQRKEKEAANGIISGNPDKECNPGRVQRKAADRNVEKADA